MAIIRTDYEKSVLFMLSAIITPNKTTIVITLLILLQDNIQEQYKTAQISNVK
jgi:hypothetical protein